MKIVIITSQVTLVPKNYFAFLEAFIDEKNKFKDFEIELEIIFLKNFEYNLIVKGIGLIVIGCPRIGFQLIKNCIEGLFYDRRKIYLKKKNIIFHEFKTPNSKEFRKYLKNNKIEILLNSRTRYIYNQKTLTSTNYLPLNIHHGILPNQRGLMCDLWALSMNNEIGFSIHKMNKNIDEGDIFKTYKQNQNLEDIIKKKDYLEYIYRSSSIEGVEAFKLITTIKNASPNPNIGNEIKYYSNPKINDIFKFKKIGLKL